MCGITAIFNQTYPSNILVKMNQNIRHRGPDDEGYVYFEGDTCYISGGDDTPISDDSQFVSYYPVKNQIPEHYFLGMGHRRLSILDLSKTGHQPISYSDSRFWMAFNGEVYNYLELRDELIKHGHKFISRTDTEVVLAAYAEWGAECVKHFIGMWSFIIYDRKERKVFISRDPFGIKPLYIFKFNSNWAISSEIAAFFAIPDFKKTVQDKTLFDFVQHGVTDHTENTFYKEIQILLPGTYIESGVEKLTDPIQYWSPKIKTQKISLEDATLELRRLFEKTIQYHMRSDVPVGAALSGGLDSSSVVCGISKYFKDFPLQCFSYIPDRLDISEEKWIDLVTQQTGFQSHKKRFSSDALLSEILQFTKVQQEPFVSTSMFAQYKVYELVNQHGIKVCLDGQGSDEILGGYHYYSVVRLAQLLKTLHLPSFFKLYSSSLKSGFLKPGRSLLDITGNLSPQLKAYYLKYFSKRNRYLNLNQFNLDTNNLYHPLFRSKNKSNLKHYLTKSLTQTSLPALLRYQDRSSMHFSIESRVPFLNTELVQFVLSLNESFLISNSGVTKNILREAVRGMVPEAIIDRKDKIGFSTPEKTWVSKHANELIDLLNHSKFDQPFLNIKELKNSLKVISSNQLKYDASVWRTLNAFLWLEQNQCSF